MSDKEKLLLPVGNNQKNENPTDEKPPLTIPPKLRLLVGHIQQLSLVVKEKIGRSEKPFYRHVWFWAGLGLGTTIIGLNYGIRTVDSSLPDKSELNAMIRQQTLTIKAGDNTVLMQQGEATRDQLKIQQIPDKLQLAFIASEDRRFRQHDGVDFQGIVRAVVSNFQSQNVVQGGSTITQQLARILFLSQERTLWRKLKEVRLAQKIEQELSKQEILERYLNLVYLGSGAYGVADASWVYFGKTVDQLNLSEMATIAGLAPAPNIYAPDKNLPGATARRNTVLQRMEEDGVITPQEKQSALQQTLTVKTNLPRRFQVTAPYFCAYVQQQLPKYLKPDVLAAGGLTVETSLNPNWQKLAEKVLVRTLKNEGTWGRFREGALVSINPRNGEIQVMVGGKDFAKTQFNRVTQAQRQPGSTFKTFVYAAAIASGKNPNDTYMDRQISFRGYEPKNYSEKFRGLMTMQDALALSINTISLQVLIDVGYEPTIKIAHNMGIKSPLEHNYSLALGSNEVNLLELTSAYGSFATQGLHTEAHAIRRILNRQGDVIWSANFQPKRALDTDSSRIVTKMLTNVVSNGTGRAAQLPDRRVAGKTGTSDESRDLWFIGYIPQMVTGIWLGNDNNRPTYGSSSTAAYTWSKFMGGAVKDLKVEKFPPPSRVAKRKPTIKAQPISKKNAGFKISKRDDNSDSQDSTLSTRQSRRRERSYEQLDQNQDTSTRRRRRRRYDVQTVLPSTDENTTSTRRRRRRRNDVQTVLPSTEENTTSTRRRRRRRNDVQTVLPSTEENTTSTRRRRRRRNDVQTVPSSTGENRNSVNNSPNSPARQPSWRERLKPDS
ncbi:transglycosylase domain-containing protein [Cylindrospermopsis raciborskii]|uniref:transglycosylase domain-containing protein n=1 Tax=Cylindrospermopsis raciborskii TaxID=77022 RepID=UPI0038CFBCB9